MVPCSLVFHSRPDPYHMEHPAYWRNLCNMLWCVGRCVDVVAVGSGIVMSDKKMENVPMEDLGCLPHGAHLYRKANGIGGYTYYSEEISSGVMVWDTCLISESTLLAVMLCEHHRKHMEYLEGRGWKPRVGLVPDTMAAVGGTFISREIQEEIDRLKE